MATELAMAHIRAEARLRRLVKQALERIWHGLPGYDEANVPQWLAAAVPVVRAGQLQSVSLTEGYLGRAMDRRPFGIDPSTVTGAATRNGTPLEVAYRRPFVHLWSRLEEGDLWNEAAAGALARAQEMSAFDVQASMARTAQAVGRTDSQIQRFQRVADGSACDFCAECDGAILNSEDVMPLHNGCGCSVEPLEEAKPVTPHSDFSGVAIHDHGEMGPTLSGAGEHFTTESELH